MNSKARITQDAFVKQTEPDTNFGPASFLAVGNVGGAIRRALIYAPRPFRFGSTIISATLKVYAASAWAGGPTTITVKRVTQAWRENRVTYDDAPAVVSTNSASAIVAAGSPTGTLVEFDVTDMIQDVANGVAYHGFELSTVSAQTNRLHSAESIAASLRPTLEIEWSTTPAQPVDLRPAGGQKVSLSGPTLTWRHIDLDGEDQAAFQVQVDDATTFTSLLHDSGWVVSAASEYDLAAAGVVVGDGDTRYWRVRTRDSYGLVSEWSDTASFARDAKGVLTITSPAGATVDDLTPVIIHTFTGETQVAVQHILQLLDEDSGVYETIYDTDRVATTDTSFTIPADLIDADGPSYRIIVRVWDDDDRVATPGDPRYVQASHVFTYDRSGAPDPVLTLTAADGVDDDAPGVVLTWTRTNAPDYFAIKVDGVVLWPRLDPADHLVSGTTYRKVVYRLLPREEHEIEVEAVVISAGKRQHSDGNPTVEFTPRPSGAWLVAPSYGLSCVITGKGTTRKQITSNRQIIRLLNRRDPVENRNKIGGYAGSINGRLASCFGRAGIAWRRRLESMVGLPPGTEIWLIANDAAFRVSIGDPEINAQSHDLYEVAIPFEQVADFTVRLRS